MRLELHLPTIVEDGESPWTASRIGDAARAAEASGFDGVWCGDHLVAPRAGYSWAWLDPLIGLSLAAVGTVNVRLGTSVLLAPLWPPPLLLKQVATLASIAPGRVTLGLGAGWDRSDYELLGLPYERRGELLDKVIEALRAPDWEMTFGLPSTRIRILIGGGGRAEGAEADQPVEVNPRVLDRIVQADGWIARPLASVDQVLRDEQLIEAAIATKRRPSFEIVHLVYADFPWRTKTDARESDARVAAACGAKRPFDVMAQCVVRGSLEDMAIQLEWRGAAGADTVILLPLTMKPDYVERLAPLVPVARRI